MSEILIKCVCGSRGIVYPVIDRVTEKKTGYAVKCSNVCSCGRLAFFFDTEQEAVKGWNDLIKEEKCRIGKNRRKA